MKRIDQLRVVWLCIGCAIQADEISHDNYIYFSPGETVLLTCMTDVNKSVWNGPAHRNNSPMKGTDVGNTSVYATGKMVNPHLTHKNRLTIIDNTLMGGSNLQIRNVSRDDQGLYICHSTYNGSVATARFVLQQKMNPSNMTFINETKEHILNGIDNSTMRIVCIVQSGNPPEQLSLRQDNSIVKIGSHGRIEHTFRATKLYHNKEYTCEANTSLLKQPLRRNVQINIKYKPLVSIMDSMTNYISEGATKDLCCKVDSNPESISTKLVNGSQYILEKNNVQDLCYQIFKVSRYDHGNYTCIAENEIGSSSTTILIKVKFPPDIHIYFKNFTIHDKLRKIQCKPEGFPVNYTYGVWEHQSEFNEHIRYLNSTDNGTLILPKVTEASDEYQDSGNYICKATNGVPSRHHFQKGKAFIVSKGPPVFVIQNSAIQYGAKGKHMIIRLYILSHSKIYCNVIRAVDPIIDVVNEENKFIKSAKVVDMFHGKNVTVNGMEVLFDFGKVEQKHFQVYNITVCNEFGNTTYSVNLVSTDVIDPGVTMAGGKTSVAVVSISVVLAAIIIVFILVLLSIGFVVFIFAVILISTIKRRSKNIKLRKKTNSGNLDIELDTVEGLAEPVENVMYQSTQQGQNNMQSSPASTLLPGDDSISDIGSSTLGTIRQSMESRLNYADVVFEPASAQQAARIIGLEDRTVYADVDVSLVALFSPETRSDTSSSEDDFVSVEGIENYIEKRETNN